MDILKTAVKLFVGRGSMRSYSQFGEDAIIAAMFRNQKNGVYVDVGCYHPTLYSNTYALYEKGWSGVAIDPNKDMASLFHFFRPRDTFVCTAIGNEHSEATYYAYNDGAYNSLSEKQMQALAKEKNIHPAKQYTLPIQPLASLLKTQKITKIDLLTIDVEGLDLAVLESHDWSIRPRVIIAEDHSFDALHASERKMVKFLIAKNYTLYASAGLSLIFQDNV